MGKESGSTKIVKESMGRLPTWSFGGQHCDLWSSRTYIFARVGYWDIAVRRGGVLGIESKSGITNRMNRICEQSANFEILWPMWPLFEQVVTV